MKPQARPITTSTARPAQKAVAERGHVYWAQLDPTIGSELQKTRPVVVVSITPLNRARNTVVVVPLSTSAPAIEHLSVPLTGGSTARCEHVRSIDKSRLRQKLGSLALADMQAIEKGLSRIMALGH